ncbi:MAG: CsiV family protein [Gammaproteobacteria bacterium]
MRLISLLLTALLPTVTAAQPPRSTDIRYYDVELVIFERTSDAGAFAEHWPAPGTPDTPGAIDLYRTQDSAPPLPTDNLNTNGFAPLPEDAKTLTNARIALARSPAYQPLAHLRWRQPGLDAASALPVRITAGRSFPNPLATADQGATAFGDTTQVRDPLAPTGSFAINASSTPARTAEPGTDPNPLQAAPPVQPEQLSQLDGTVRVVLGRYLHVYADLVLRRQMPEDFDSESLIAPPPTTVDGSEGALPGVETAPTPAAAAGSSFQGPGLKLHGFRMMAQRRMRSSELHYIDHPLMGILVIIDRAPGPEAQASAHQPGRG